MNKSQETSSTSVVSRIKYSKNMEIGIGVLILAVLLIVYFVSGSGISVGASSKMTDEEVRLAGTLSNIKGVGNVTVMITSNDEMISTGGMYGEDEIKTRKIEGVVVVAEGASDVSIKIDLINAVCFALNLKTYQVEVFEMK